MLISIVAVPVGKCFTFSFVRLPAAQTLRRKQNRRLAERNIRLDKAENTAVVAAERFDNLAEAELHTRQYFPSAVADKGNRVAADKRVYSAQRTRRRPYSFDNRFENSCTYA